MWFYIIILGFASGLLLAITNSHKRIFKQKQKFYPGDIVIRKCNRFSPWKEEYYREISEARLGDDNRWWYKAHRLPVDDFTYSDILIYGDEYILIKRKEVK